MTCLDFDWAGCFQDCDKLKALLFRLGLYGRFSQVQESVVLGLFSMMAGFSKNTSCFFGCFSLLRLGHNEYRFLTPKAVVSGLFSVMAGDF